MERGKVFHFSLDFLSLGFLDVSAGIEKLLTKQTVMISMFVVILLKSLLLK